MPTIQHKSLPDSERHEPKGISTAINKQVYFADGSASGAWRKITQVEIDYSDKTKNIFGWNDIADSQYTSGAPRSIAASTRTQMTNNGLGVQTDQSRLGTIWSSNQFLINDLNAFYDLRINCKVKTTSPAGTPYTVKFELESANGPLIITANDVTIKGGSYENAISLSVPFYMGNAINNFALKIFATSDIPITLYEFGTVIRRTYKET